MSANWELNNRIILFDVNEGFFFLLTAKRGKNAPNRNFFKAISQDTQ